EAQVADHVRPAFDKVFVAVFDPNYVAAAVDRLDCRGADRAVYARRRAAANENAEPAWFIVHAPPTSGTRRRPGPASPLAFPITKDAPSRERRDLISEASPASNIAEGPYLDSRQ